jgi:hypothetical protein
VARKETVDDITEKVFAVEDVLPRSKPSSVQATSTKPKQPSLVLCVEERAFGLRLPCHTAYLPLLNSRMWN